MPQSTDLNVNPFYDDFDPTNQYYRVLFRPSQAVQARELTQLQSILQNQIEEFGLNVLEQGTVVRGCTFTYIDPYPFVKIRDLQVDGQPVNVSAYANGYAVQSNNGLTAKIFNTADGLESATPNLNTLFVKYTNAGNTGTTVFANGATLAIYAWDYAVQDVDIYAAGTGYSNADTLVFTSTTGNGATGTIQTNATGSIVSVSLTAGGNNYLTTPTVTIANSTGGTANGTSGVVNAYTYIAQVTVAPNTGFASGSNTETYPTGLGYGFKISDGVIFQKGFFLYVEPQEIVITPYNTTPSNLIVGFSVTESIVNNSVDTSLNDNADGISNEGAPGAYRLKMVPTLTLKTVANVAASNDFFTLVEFQNGVPVRQRQDTTYGKLGKELAKRTSEESGNYVVKPFKIINETLAGNTDYFASWVSSGVAYINGYRVEQFGRVPLTVRKGTDVKERVGQVISTSYGSYIKVNNLVGNFPFNLSASVSLRDTAATQITDNLYATQDTPGNEIGTARVRSLQFLSGLPGTPSAEYALYLFDIKMNNGKNFANVRSVWYNDSVDGNADAVLDQYGNCTLQEPERGTLVFPFSKRAIKSLRNLANTNSTTFTYRTHKTNGTVNTLGQMAITTTDIFPYTASANLSVSEKEEIVFMMTGTAQTAANLTGTVNLVSTANTLLGNGTSFLTQLAVGDHFIANTEIHRICSISNNTVATIESNATSTATTQEFSRVYPAYRAIPLNHSILTRTVNVDSNSNTLTFSLGENLATAQTVVVSYNVNRPTAVSLTKTLSADQIVKLSMSSAALAAQKQWCLGVPDILEIKSVTKGTNADYVTGQTDVTSHFRLVSGQKDSFYGLSYLALKQTSSLVISSGDYLVVTFDVLRSANTGGGVSFYSINSYPIDDVSSSLPTDKIRTEQIPSFVSTTGSTGYELRDCIDFRPQAANTAAYTATLGSATVNPANTETFSAAEQYYPSPDKTLSTAFTYYLPRIDKIVINSLGQLSVIEGASSEDPRAPSDLPTGMTLATVMIPPFPSLSPAAAQAASKPFYGVSATYEQVERLTMKDLNQLQQRLDALEYYTSLNMLEAETTDLVIPSDLDGTLNRFKNGIFVDNFETLETSATGDPEYRASIDLARSEIRPSFDQYKIDLELDTETGLTQSGDLLVLDYTSMELLSQPYATRTRNCSEDSWNFTGSVQLIPNYDNFYETRGNPVPVTDPALPPTTNTHTTIPTNVPGGGGGGVRPRDIHWWWWDWGHMMHAN